MDKTRIKHAARGTLSGAEGGHKDGNHHGTGFGSRRNGLTTRANDPFPLLRRTRKLRKTGTERDPRGQGSASAPGISIGLALFQQSSAMKRTCPC